MLGLRGHTVGEEEPTEELAEIQSRKREVNRSASGWRP